jgi:hypothetical protein
VVVVVSVEHQNERDGRKEEGKTTAVRKRKGRGLGFARGSIWEA